MWVDYSGPLSTVYNDEKISTCGWIIEVYSVQSTTLVNFTQTHTYTQHVVRLTQTVHMLSF